jgi:hypothetical protein
MNDAKKIAKHLNLLLLRSDPYIVDTTTHDDSCMITGGCDANDGPLWERLKPIFEAATPALDAMEIAAAAKDRREADLHRPNVHPQFWRNRIPWEGSRKLWKHCEAQICAAVDADNQERMEEYERYRAMCESGVAVPPED